MRLRQRSRRVLELRSGKALRPHDVALLARQVVRMLRLTAHDDQVALAFRERSPDLAARLFRSPTLFEDIVKTFTLCNCGWGRTMAMNEKLCELIGKGAFPSAKELAKVSVARRSPLRWI